MDGARSGDELPGGKGPQVRKARAGLNGSRRQGRGRRRAGGDAPGAWSAEEGELRPDSKKARRREEKAGAGRGWGVGSVQAVRRRR